MTEDNHTTISNNNNSNEQCLVFSEQHKELASKAKQEYEAGQFDGLLMPVSVNAYEGFAF